MDATRRKNFAFRMIAALLGGTSIVILSLGDTIPDIYAWMVAAAGLICAALVLYFSYGRRALFGRSEHVNVEFRHEVERYLHDVSQGSPRGARTKSEQDEIAKSDEERPAAPRPPARERTAGPAAPTGDTLGKLTENIEVLAGYREDLVALLQLHRKLADPHTRPDEREKVSSRIAQLEKTVALPFLLEDSQAVQGEVEVLVDDLRRWLKHGPVKDTTSDETWSPVDLHSRIEMALEKLPREKARGCWFERHYGEIALILTRPQSINEAFYHIFDYFTDMVGGGQAIHVRTAQRGDYAWIGIGSAPNERASGTINLDERIEAAGRIWDDLGANVALGEMEVRILIPLHGPMHLFHEEVGESADEKTG